VKPRGAVVATRAGRKPRPVAPLVVEFEHVPMTAEQEDALVALLVRLMRR
jgi:hypothetical protein